MNTFGDEQLAVDLLADKLLFEALKYSVRCFSLITLILYQAHTPAVLLCLIKCFANDIQGQDSLGQDILLNVWDLAEICMDCDTIKAL